VLINGVDYSQKAVKICLRDIRPRGVCSKENNKSFYF